MDANGEGTSFREGMGSREKEDEKRPRRSLTRRKRQVFFLALVAFSLVLGTLGLRWKLIRAWVVLWNEFEQIDSSSRGVLEFRHRESGIVFAIDRRAP